MKQLEQIVNAFIEKHDIYSDEKIFQSDRVIEDAYYLIKELCDVVGYKQDKIYCNNCSEPIELNNNHWRHINGKRHICEQELNVAEPEDI